MRHSLLAVALLLATCLPAQAATFRAGDDVDIPPDVVISEDLYVAGGDVRIRGRIDGDLVVAGGKVTVSGEVRDDLIAAGGNVTLSGKVGETIRAAGGEVTISGEVGRDLIAAGGTVEQLATSKVGGSSVLTSGDLSVRGTTQGQLRASGGEVLIDGRVGGADIKAGELTVTPKARIEGDLTYRSDSEADIREGATITGKVTRNAPEARGWSIPGWVGGFFLLMAGSLTGIALAAIMPGALAAVGGTVRKRPWLTLLLGAGVLFGVPILSVILLITVIGIPLALTLMGIYVLSLFLAWVVAATVLGESLLLRAKLPSPRIRMIASAVIGVAVLLLLQALPWVGGLFAVLAILVGLGGTALAAGRRVSRPS